MTTPRPGEEVDQLGMPVRLHYTLFSFFSLVMAGVPLAISFTEAGHMLASLPLRLICVNGMFMIVIYQIWGRLNGFRRDPCV